MKKVIIPLAVFAAVVIGVLVFLNVRKDKKAEAENQQAATAAEDTIDFAELLGGRGLEQAVRIPGSDKIAYIEGISEQEATALNNAFRCYEEAMGAEVDEANNQAYLYTEIGPAIEAWFDPATDTVAAFNATEHDPTGVLAWLTNPLEEALTREDCANAFYFKEREDGNYTMSYGYYMVGLAHSGAWKLAQQAEQ